jgi:plasmid stabilization system protein ParE
MARRRIRFLPRADTELAALEEYLSLRAGPFVADRWLRRILRRIDILASEPGMGRVHRKIEGHVLQASVVRPWLVYEDNEVENELLIRAVVDTRQDLDRMKF